MYIVQGWFTASILIFFVGLAMADMASAMPTAGGLYWWTHYFAGEKWKNPLSFLVGYSNTLGLIGGICSVDCTPLHFFFQALFDLGGHTLTRL
jgi:amino acid transporter